MPDSEHVREAKSKLRLVLLEKLKVSPPKSRGVFGLGFWMGAHLTFLQQQELDIIGYECGEVAANEWLTSVLVESGLWKETAEGVVEPK
jgi:hypothetical protein